MVCSHVKASLHYLMGLQPFVLARNYHVFYYLLAGASEEERLAFHLRNPDEYHYLNQVRLPAHSDTSVKKLGDGEIFVKGKIRLPNP